MPVSILDGRRWFQRRCDRTEYWLTIGLLLGLPAAAQSWPLAAGLGLNLAVFVLAARRLHDLGRSGWWIALVPAGQAVAAVAWFQMRLLDRPMVIGVCAATTATIVVLGLIAGEREANRFGPPPSRPDLTEAPT